MTQSPLITVTPAGLYCRKADLYIDPWRPVPRALITHGHADHARRGHQHYMCTTLADPVLRHRLGDIKIETLPYGTEIDVGGVTISFHPAGHVIGSAQIRLAHKGQVWVISGDYKREDDGITTPFEPQRCTHFVTECTFGLPIFKWAPQQHIAAELNAWWRSQAAAGRTCLLGAYSLGKAQRILSMLDPSIGPILTHAAIDATNQIIRAQGISLPETRTLDPDTTVKPPAGAFAIAPPAALESNWAKRLGPRSTGFASGWMRIRGIRRRRAADRGFIISDHADWDGLLKTVADTGAENIYPTHGYTDIFARHLNDLGYFTQIIPTRFEGDEPDAQTAAETQTQ
jgi:putative mRNA 3-end processing factor